ncbi:MAG TPA: hypothetical protein VK444_00860 [Methanobacteriaceae archaeon]|nr:hypothetical protein [Methanobacteriaceae archaeon]
MKNIIKTVLILVVILVVILAAVLIWANLGQHTNLGSNSNGYVTKDVYSHYGVPTVRIAIVTGMHPRENLATTMVPQAIKLFALLNRVEVADYHITVQNQPENFDVGRNNGEALAAQYAVPDIIKSNYSLTIISHDHEQGYGDGYYIATPTRDDKSVSMGEAVHQLLPQFNFYPGSSETRTHASSVILVDNPLAKVNIPVFVYEMPEWHNALDAIYNTYQLISASSKVLQST